MGLGGRHRSNRRSAPRRDKHRGVPGSSGDQLGVLWILFLYRIYVDGWAGIEGRVTKHCFCVFMCLASQRERSFFVNFEHFDSTKCIVSSYFSDFFCFGGLGSGGQ